MYSELLVATMLSPLRTNPRPTSRVAPHVHSRDKAARRSLREVQEEEIKSLVNSSHTEQHLLKLLM